MLGLYRANTFFRNFEIQGPPDRLLIYGILWCGEVVGKIRTGFGVRYVDGCCFVGVEERMGARVETWMYGRMDADALSREATKEVQNIALDNNFAIPGDPGFPLNQVRLFPSLSYLLRSTSPFRMPAITNSTKMFEPPRDRQDAETLRQYLSQVRQELAARLLARIYEEGGDGKPSKWWLSFTKRKFMGKSLS